MDKDKKDLFQYALAALIVGGFFLVLGGLLFVIVPSGNEKALDITLGALVAGFSGVLGYFFGSSKGSSEKDAIIAGQANTPAGPAA